MSTHPMAVVLIASPKVKLAIAPKEGIRENPRSPFRKQSHLGAADPCAGPRLLSEIIAPAIAALSLDRLLRQPRPSQ